jgi:hypothetical protein
VAIEVESRTHGSALLRELTILHETLVSAQADLICGCVACLSRQFSSLYELMAY